MHARARPHSQALYTLGPKIMLVRGCENVTGNMRQEQTSPNRIQALFLDPVIVKRNIETIPKMVFTFAFTICEQ